MTQETAVAEDAGAAAGGADYPLRVRRIDPAKEQARLETYVRRMERRYEYGSDEMLARLQTGAQKCTADISQWMFNYRSLVRRRDGYDPATGERFGSGTAPAEPATGRGA